MRDIRHEALAEEALADFLLGLWERLAAPREEGTQVIGAVIPLLPYLPHASSHPAAVRQPSGSQRRLPTPLPVGAQRRRHLLLGAMMVRRGEKPRVT